MNDGERLARFEAALAALAEERESVITTLDDLRAHRTTRTATYQQMAARKLVLKAALAPFEEAGLL